VVIDLSMPELDGLEAIQLIARASPSTAIVVFSGFSADRMHAVASEAGADRYLEKGARLTLLSGLLRDAVHERRQRVRTGRPLSPPQPKAPGSRREASSRRRPH
jgi:DNA-binding NarL/FixJ family response regulator